MADTISGVLSSPTAAAQRVAAPTWETAIANIRANGTYRPANSPFPATIGLADITGPRESTHQADYMNLWGVRRADCSFSAREASIVSESWTATPDGNLHFDQWLHKLGMDGTAQSASHRWVLQGPSGRVLGFGSYPVQPGEAEASLAALVDKFATFVPPADPSASACVPSDRVEKRAELDLRPRVAQVRGLAVPHSRAK